MAKEDDDVKGLKIPQSIFNPHPPHPLPHKRNSINASR